MYYYFLFFTTLLAADQVSKWLAATYLDADLVLLPFLRFSLVWNKGISWGMLTFEHAGSRLLLTGTILFVTLLFFIYTYSEYQRKKNIFFQTMVLAGAISNIIDRFVYGAVVDFIEFYYKSWYWPTFNVADIFIVLGISGILIKNWLYDTEKDGE